MKVFSSRGHGVVDYLGGAALIAAPYLFGFAEVGGAAVTSAQIIGALVLGQSLMTDYELGVLGVIPFRMHLAMDVLISLFLAASPFIFGFYTLTANAWLPHVVVGLGYFVITLLTDSTVKSHAGTERGPAMGY